MERLKGFAGARKGRHSRQLAAIWVRSDVTVYPVQGNDEIIFTDGQGIFLKFDGWHFTEVRGYRARDVELISGKPDIVGFDYGTSDSRQCGR